MNLSWTSLPNLHPLVVHLPIGILPLALVLDIALLLRRRWVWLDRAVALLFLIGAAGAAVAVWAGERAADSLVDVPAALQPVIGRHSDWGHYVLYWFGALALLRALPAWSDRDRDTVTRVALRAGLAVAALIGVLVLARAADKGGALVYRHGLGVAQPESAASVEAPTPAPARSSAAEASSRLERGVDGALTWRPTAADSAALGEIVVAAQGTTLDVLSAASSNSGAPGLALAVDGRVVLRFEEDIADVQVDAEIEIESFSGTVGVAHHLRQPSDGGFLLLTSAGEVSLLDVRDGSTDVLDQQTAPSPQGAFTLSVSSAGRHLKGMIDGETVVHGHVAAPDPGGCGLVLDGVGVVRIRSVRVTPLES